MEVRRVSPGLVNVIQVALVSEDAPYSELEDHARALKDLLKTVRWRAHRGELGLSAARAARRGGPGAHGGRACRAGQVLQAMQSENASIPAGFVDLGARSFSLKTPAPIPRSSRCATR